MLRDVVVTGLGVVSPVGNDVQTFFRSLCQGRSGVSFIRAFPTDRLRSDIAAHVTGLDASGVLDSRELEMHGRVTQMLVVAADEAIRHSGVRAVDPDRVGVLLGTGQGPVDVLENNFAHVQAKGLRTVSPFFIPTAMPNAATALVSIKCGFGGPSFTLASACATGTHAIITSALFIATGEADAMIAGGGEAAILPGCVAGFGNTRALARAYQGDPTRASRPYDTRRSGFVMGEGAGALVLEAGETARARGATILARLTGWGMTSDAEHLARPNADGRGLRRCIEIAMRRAGVSAADIGYINPHATSTPQGDLAEYHALRGALGDALRTIPLSATKSLIGHLLGGAGAAEAVATVCTLTEGFAHPSINVDELDPAFEIDLVTEKRSVTVRAALKTSAGFGGHDAALIFERA